MIVKPSVQRYIMEFMKRGRQRSRTLLLPAALACLSFGQASMGDPLHAIEDGAFWHHGSDWIFPNEVGGFARVGAPQEIDGSNDVAAHYERVVNGVRTVASVTIYPPDSAAGDATFANSKAAIELKLKSTAASQVWSEGPFRVGTERPLVGIKVFYKLGVGPASSQTNLYFIDTGAWIVKIRMTTEKTEQDTFQVLDDFVRQQRWASLALSDQTCTGAACDTQRAMPVHGATPELVALQKGAELLYRPSPKMNACDTQAIETAFAAEPKVQADGALDWFESVATCSLQSGFEAHFFRVALPSDVLQVIEMESPDGLSLRGPLSFAVLRDRKRAYFTEMHDGKLRAGDLTEILERLAGDEHRDFATAKRNGANPEPVVRFVR